MSGSGLLLQRGPLRYLARIVAGTPPPLRVGVRVQLRPLGPLPTAAADGPPGPPVVRAGLVRAGSRPAAVTVELRPLPRPVPTVRPAELPVRPARALPTVLEALAPDGTRLRFLVRSMAPPGAPLPPAEGAGGEHDGPGPLTARVIAGAGGARRLLELGELRLPLTAEAGGLEPGTGLRLQLATRPAGPSPATADGPQAADAPAAALVRPLHGFPAPAAGTPPATRDLADALSRVLLPLAAAGDDAGSAADGTPPEAGRGASSARAELPPRTGTWLVGGLSGETALLRAGFEPGGEDETGDRARRKRTPPRRLYVELDLSRLGRVRLELDATGGPRRLLLRSERPLPERCRAGIADFFGAALEAAGRPGQLVFARLAPSADASGSGIVPTGPGLWA